MNLRQQYPHHSRTTYCGKEWIYTHSRAEADTDHGKPYGEQQYTYVESPAEQAVTTAASQAYDEQRQADYYARQASRDPYNA